MADKLSEYDGRLKTMDGRNPCSKTDSDATFMRMKEDAMNNRKTHHTANLSKGNPNNGTSIQSYTNNERNATSDNRMWDICVVDSIQGQETDLRRVENVPMDYALAYNPTTHFLHFGADDPEQLSFIVDVYDQLGRRVMRFPARKGASVEHLPEGPYILTWYYRGKHSVKLLR